MDTLESIADLFHSLEPAQGGRWNTHALVPERLHVSRGENNEHALFIEGSLDSFGNVPRLRGIAHNKEVTALPSSRTFQALRISSTQGPHGDRLLAHIAYELSKRLHEMPTLSNLQLFDEVGWILSLLGERDMLLSSEMQRGLAGESMLLRSLLIVARSLSLPATAVLNRWWGPSQTKRDFAALGIAIEAKATSANTRQHHISSIEQLDPQEGEVVYVYSVGLKSDATAPRKLPDYLSDVELQMLLPDGSPDTAAVAKFREACADYGYDFALEDFYRGSPGFLTPHLAPALFRETDLDRLRHTSFVNDTFPSMVVAVSYVLNIQATPVTQSEMQTILRELLTRPVVSDK